MATATPSLPAAEAKIDDCQRTMRRTMFLAAFAYTAFVIYGSLVPLDFRAIPWDEALARLREIPYLSLGIGSRADWVANLLLFIPLTFLWTGAISHGRTRRTKFLTTCCVIICAAILSIGIEFTQIFFPPRTVSQNDILAEAIGGLIGAVTWVLYGERLTHWYEGLRQAHQRAAVAERWAWLYLAGLLVYNLLPLDLTISPVEVFHKWQEGKVRLVPFAEISGDPAMVLYELLTDALIWTPLAFLWRLGAGRGAVRAWSMTIASAALVEGLQLFVYSRLTDTTDLLTAAIGSAAGVLLAGRLSATQSGLGSTSARRAAQPIRLPLILIAGWLAILMIVFWYPFDFRADSGFLKDRISFLGRVPFETYYFGTEYRAATEFLHKTLFFAPLGGLLGWVTDRCRLPWRRTATALAVVGVVLVALGVEFGQMMLPGRIPDTTDWLLESAAAICGLFVVRHFLRVTKAKQPEGLSSPPRVLPATATTQATKPQMPARWQATLVVAVMTLGIWGAANAPFAPYNVRELLESTSPILSAALLALCCYWVAVWPVRLARGYTVSLHTLWLLPVGLALYGGVAYLLLRLAVPQESIDDIVGTPIKGWIWEWESLLRFLGLAAIPGALLYLAAQSTRQLRGLRLGVWHWVAALLVLAVAHWIVVVQAATDNLVELLAPHPLAFASLCAFLFTLFLAAALIASPALRGRLSVAVTILLLSLMLAPILLVGGLAGEISKYGERFSAMQFLLSRNRQAYAGTVELWTRYSFLHFLVIGALVAMQWPHFRTRSLRGNHRLHRPAILGGRISFALAARTPVGDPSAQPPPLHPPPRTSQP